MTTHIKTIIEEFLKEKQKNIPQQQQIKTVIAKVLPQELKTSVFLKKLTQETVVFGSNSSSASYNFNLLKENLKKEIQKTFPEIKKVTIETGGE